jgi:hypothetical protein
MRLGVITSITYTREPPKMVVAVSGGLPDQVLKFSSGAEVLAKYDELVEIEEKENQNVEA